MNNDNIMISTGRMFPDWLPYQPPTPDETTQLLEVWENVENIADIRWRNRNGKKELEYMIVTTTEARQHRLIWQDEQNQWFIRERTTPN
jgi:hypothetical protein